MAPQSSLLKVKKDIKPEYAAAIAVNPCTAYRLLNDFADLKPGTIIPPPSGRTCFICAPSLLERE